MFAIDGDTINVTRGDIAYFSVKAKEDNGYHTFKAGDIIRIKVFGKKDCENVVLQKDFPVTTNTDTVEIFLDKVDTKIGDAISKPVNYWYEIELNPENNPQTIIAYNEDGAKVFTLYPEGEDTEAEEPEITPEDVPVIDGELNLLSVRPVTNKAIAREILAIKEDIADIKNLLSELVVDEELSANSENPVMNKVITAEIDGIGEKLVKEENARVDLEKALLNKINALNKAVVELGGTIE